VKVKGEIRRQSSWGKPGMENHLPAPADNFDQFSFLRVYSGGFMV